VVDPIPIEERVPFAVLDSVVRFTVLETGLPREYAFGIVNAASDSVIWAKPGTAVEEIRTSPFRARLFPGDILMASNDLILHFPGQRRTLFKSVGPVIAAALVFIVVLVLGSVQAFRALVSQRRFARSFTDFVNNMTHEFKTPIHDDLPGRERPGPGRGPRPGQNRKRGPSIRRCIGRREILRSPFPENRPGTGAGVSGRVRTDHPRRKRPHEKSCGKDPRDRGLETGEIEIRREKVDLHEILSRVALNSSVQVKEKGGILTIALDAPTHVVNGDALHLENVFHNLVDNALKYNHLAPGSPSPPPMPGTRSGWPSGTTDRHPFHRPEADL